MESAAPTSSLPTTAPRARAAADAAKSRAKLRAVSTSIAAMIASLPVSITRPLRSVIPLSRDNGIASDFTGLFEGVFCICGVARREKN